MTTATVAADLKSTINSIKHAKDGSEVAAIVQKFIARQDQKSASVQKLLSSLNQGGSISGASSNSSQAASSFNGFNASSAGMKSYQQATSSGNKSGFLNGILIKG